MNIRDLISYPPAYDIDLDSDEVEAKLAALNIDPDNCTIADAISALRQMPPATRPRVGAPRGNINRSVSNPRNFTVRFRVNAEELALLERSAGGESVGTWVRNMALKASKQTKE